MGNARPTLTTTLRSYDLFDDAMGNFDYAAPNDRMTVNNTWELQWSLCNLTSVGVPEDLQTGDLLNQRVRTVIATDNLLFFCHSVLRWK